MKYSLYVIQLQNYWPVNVFKKRKGMIDCSYLPLTPKALGNMQVTFTLVPLITNYKEKEETKTNNLVSQAKANVLLTTCYPM